MDEPDHGKAHTTPLGQGVSLSKSAQVEEVKTHFFNSKKAETVVSKVEGVKVGFKKSDRVSENTGSDGKAVGEDKQPPLGMGPGTFDGENTKTGMATGGYRKEGGDQHRGEGEGKAFGRMGVAKQDSFKVEGGRQDMPFGKNEKGGFGLERDRGTKGHPFDRQPFARDQSNLDSKLAKDVKANNHADRVHESRDETKPKDPLKTGFKNRLGSEHDYSHKEDKLRLEHPGSSKTQGVVLSKQHPIEPRKGGFGDSDENDWHRNNAEWSKEDNPSRGNPQFKGNRDQKRPRAQGHEDQFVKKPSGPSDDFGHKPRVVDSNEDDLRYGNEPYKEAKKPPNNTESRKDNFEGQSKQHYPKHNHGSGQADGELKRQGDRHRGHRNNQKNKGNSRRVEGDDLEQWEPQNPKAEVEGYVKKGEESKKKNNSGESDGKKTDFGSNIFTLLATNKRN